MRLILRRSRLKLTNDADAIAGVFAAIGLTVSLGFAMAFSSAGTSTAIALVVPLPGL
jgi:hypothetical protein